MKFSKVLFAFLTVIATTVPALADLDIDFDIIINPGIIGHPGFHGHPGNYFGRAEVLGETLIGRKNDVDTIDIRSCATSREKAVALKLRTAGAPVDIHRVRVTYGNGQTESLPLAGTYYTGANYGWYHLNQPRCIRSVTIFGNGRGGNASVRVLGLMVR